MTPDRDPVRGTVKYDLSRPPVPIAFVDAAGKRIEDVDMRDDERKRKMLIRNGLRAILQGIEELWGLPRSFETKREQGRRQEG